MKESIKELAQTGSTSVAGASFTAAGLQPVLFLKDLVNAAKKQLYFANFVRTQTAQEGVKDVVIPKRKAYTSRTGMSYDAGELTSTSSINWTTLDTLSSVIATPTSQLSGYAITKYALRTNALNLVNEAKEELSYAIGDKVDRTIVTSIGDATAATNSAQGCQSIYGGDATSYATLATGDVITTDLVAKAKKYLSASTLKYRANGQHGSESTSGVAKNPWANSNDDPFVLFIGPAQEETFLKDSQFVNAAEYGSDMVIQNGEIGSYLGIRIVVTHNLEFTPSGTTFGSGTPAPAPTGETTGASATDITRCILAKMKSACALVWGRQPEVKVWDYNEQDQVRISLVTEYAVKVIHDDAIVLIEVSDS